MACPGKWKGLNQRSPGLIFTHAHFTREPKGRPNPWGVPRNTHLIGPLTAGHRISPPKLPRSTCGGLILWLRERKCLGFCQTQPSVPEQEGPKNGFLDSVSFPSNLKLAQKMPHIESHKSIWGRVPCLPQGKKAHQFQRNLV